MKKEEAKYTLGPSKSKTISNRTPDEGPCKAPERPRGQQAQDMLSLLLRSQISSLQKQRLKNQDLILHLKEFGRRLSCKPDLISITHPIQVKYQETAYLLQGSLILGNIHFVLLCTPLVLAGKPSRGLGSSACLPLPSLEDTIGSSSLQ